MQRKTTEEKFNYCLGNIIDRISKAKLQELGINSIDGL